MNYKLRHIKLVMNVIELKDKSNGLDVLKNSQLPSELGVGLKKNKAVMRYFFPYV